MVLIDTLAQNRWYEIQLYFICTELLKRRNNMLDVMSIIEGLAPIGKYSAEPVKLVVQEVLSSMRSRPSKEEFILLSKKAGRTIRAIAEQTHAHNRTLYALFKDEERNPRYFYPRLTADQTELIKAFVETFNSLKEVAF